MIEMFHVSKSYGKENQALQDINLRIEKGEFIFLVGGSGAGKSTLLKLFFCQERPDQGQIVVEGKNIARLPPIQVPYLRRNIGFVFQDFRLIGRKTVYENVSLPLEIVGSPVDEIKRRVNEILNSLKIEPLRGRLPETLSIGEQQRVAIARALVNRPSVVLADEPTGNLDDALSDEVVELFKNAHARGTTVVIATHHRSLLSKVSKRTVFLQKGRIISEGRPV